MPVEFGDPRLPPRFWSKVHVAESGCWEWTAWIKPAGYGYYNTNGSTNLAHRFAYATLVAAIPAHLMCDHLCRNRRCVNPNHIEPVTNRENALRGETINARNAAATHCPAGHPYDEANTYRHPYGDRRCRACGRESARRRRSKDRA